MKHEYLILDFGNVLAYPVTGHWFITNKFIELIDMNKIDDEMLKMAIHKYRRILARKASTLKEEEKIFYDFYKSILKEMKYSLEDDNIIKEISYDFTYNYEKCKLYDDVITSLEILHNKYKLLLLSDNWPCGTEIMKYYGADKYFLHMYISSVYGYLKEEGKFFDYPINDYHIKPHEALFIDDNENILDVAVTKGVDVKIMKRDRLSESKYPIITSLNDLTKEVE